MEKEYQLQLFEKMIQGDTSALTELLAEGVRLSVSMASKYTTDPFELRLYTEAGIRGYFIAISHYQRSEGYGKFKFTTYATWFMRKEIEEIFESKIQ